MGCQTRVRDVERRSLTGSNSGYATKNKYRNLMRKLVVEGDWMQKRFHDIECQTKRDVKDETKKKTRTLTD